MKKIFLSLLVLFFIIKAESQVSIYGKMLNTSMVNKIELKVNEYYLNGGTKTYETSVKDDDTFEFQIQVDYPQVVRLIYSRNTLELYVEPNDRIQIQADGNRFPFGVKFGDKGGANNACWSAYQEEFPRHRNQFEYTRYRSGLYWFTVPPKINDMMLRMSKAGFAETMNARKRNREKFINTFTTTNGQQLSPVFKQYMNDEIKYEYAYYMFCFGDVFKNKHYVTSTFFDKVNPIVFGKEEQMGGYFYREFIKAYINHEYMRLNNNDVNGIINKQYDLSEQYLTGKDLAFFKSEIIAKALKRKKVDVILDKYNAFLLNNQYPEFNDKIIAHYQKAIKYHIGSPAPLFQFTTLEGKLLNLKELKGKPVFLNFWATWCHSCMKKMDKTKALQEEMEKKGMVFIHVSFDRDKNQWKKTIEEKGYGGHHIFLPNGVESPIAKDYNIRALPQYYLIDKYGNFAKPPLRNNVEEIKKAMEWLVR